MIIREKVLYLEDYLLKGIEKGDFPGASFGLIGMEESYNNFLGNSDIEPKTIGLKEDTIYDLASLTKVVGTTTGIMILIERGYLTLDTLVSSILPRYKNVNIRIKHLLCHTSGHEIDIDCMGIDREELIDIIYDDMIDPSKFEKEVIYSDIGYILLGFIIEEITGSLENFLSENIFKPLDMKDTGFNPKHRDRCAPTEFCNMRDEMVRGIVHDEKSFLLGGVAGHAGLFSTAKDLLNFISMYLNGGSFRENEIISRESIDLMASHHTQNGDIERGLGWIIKGERNTFCDLASSKAIYHTGFTGTSIIIDLYYKKGFVLLTNRVHPSRENHGLANSRRNIHNIAISAIRSKEGNK